jgi:hypothetical protein
MRLRQLYVALRRADLHFSVCKALQLPDLPRATVELAVVQDDTCAIAIAVTRAVKQMAEHPLLCMRQQLFCRMVRLFLRFPKVTHRCKCQWGEFFAVMQRQLKDLCMMCSAPRVHRQFRHLLNSTRKREDWEVL